MDKRETESTFDPVAMLVNRIRAAKHRSHGREIEAHLLRGGAVERIHWPNGQWKDVKRNQLVAMKGIVRTVQYHHAKEDH
jgi:hypothetical protein